jgi:F-type H+-transporting ATPase subunit gamma
MLVDRPRKNLGILLISADRGLCGSYHSTVMRQALRLEKELIELGLTPKFYLVGNKIIQGFKRYSHSPVLGRMGNMTAAPSHAHAHQIAETLTQAFLSNEIDQIEILSTHFVSMISYKPQLTAVLPVTLDAHSPQPQQRSSEMILSPDPVETLDQLVPMYLTNIIYRQLLEASASEHAARMTAMSNATSNAGEMINKLTIVYNKLRQASITQELLEVVSGAQALQ